MTTQNDMAHQKPKTRRASGLTYVHAEDHVYD